MAFRAAASLFDHVTSHFNPFRLAILSGGRSRMSGPPRARHLHSTTAAQASSSSRRKGKRDQGDPRVRLIRYHLQHPKTPRPLRFSRMRSLRHWTIHRAWLLFKRKRREAEERELLRMYQCMHDACEELRNLDGNGGRLYRIAMEKKGIYGPNGVPIEYARAQTETRAREPWNHDWKR